MLRLLRSKPPDEDAFQSDHTTQMLRLAGGNHTQKDWRLRGGHQRWAWSKFFSTHDETGHYWKNCAQISPNVRTVLSCSVCGVLSLFNVTPQ